MFGYMETDYDVVARQELQCGGMRQVFEHRESTFRKTFGGVEKLSYLAIEGYNSEGKLVMDVLLLYPDEYAQNLAADWQRLCTEPQLKLSELQHFERIVGHGTGYRRDGCVVMY